MKKIETKIFDYTEITFDQTASELTQGGNLRWIPEGTWGPRP